MPYRLPESVYHQINELWARSQVEPGFATVLKEAIEPADAQVAGQSDSLSPWTRLPELCCQAVGGSPSLAEPLTAAWLLFYKAAHILDAIEDQDPPEAWWAEKSPGYALNAASGLFFSAAQLLNQLYDQENTSQAAAEVSADFYTGFLRMCAGQHLDLLWQKPDLDQYWQIAAGKSGSFFGLACWGGARLANAEAGRCAAMRAFGQNLGILVQMRDDLEDYQGLSSSTSTLLPSKISRSLPFVYAWEVSPSEDRAGLLAALQAASQDAAYMDSFLERVDRTGAGIYLGVEMERYRNLASKALDEAMPEQPFADALRSFLKGSG